MPRSQTGSKEQSILAYFTTAPLEIALLVLSLVQGAVRERKAKRDAQVEAGKKIAAKIARSKHPAGVAADRPRAKAKAKAKRKPALAPVVDDGPEPAE